MLFRSLTWKKTSRISFSLSSLLARIQALPGPLPIQPHQVGQSLVRPEHDVGAVRQDQRAHGGPDAADAHNSFASGASAMFDGAVLASASPPLLADSRGEHDIPRRRVGRGDLLGIPVRGRAERGLGLRSGSGRGLVSSATTEEKEASEERGASRRFRRSGGSSSSSSCCCCGRGGVSICHCCSRREKGREKEEEAEEKTERARGRGC